MPKTADEKFRAYDKSNGELLWETQLPATAFATPATYMVEGKQYIMDRKKNLYCRIYGHSIARIGHKTGRPPTLQSFKLMTI